MTTATGYLAEQTYLSKTEACAFLRLSLPTLTRLIKSGKLRCYSTSVGRVVLKRVELEAWVEGAK
jgi:excisionase family DNA binding protein